MATKVKVCVCELRLRTEEELAASWKSLKQHAAVEKPDILLFPEMPFYKWLAALEKKDQSEWEKAVKAHEEWIGRLGELGVPVVVSSRPAVVNGKNHNLGFVWQGGSFRDIHTKCYLPNHEGYWESTWYERNATPTFEPATVTIPGKGDVVIGIQICTDIWFIEHARLLGKKGMEILFCPRATQVAGAAKWIKGGSISAVCGGAFCLSSNHVHDDKWFCGKGYISTPAGETIAVTDPKAPIMTVEIDLQEARAAKKTYPRYVPEY